MRSKESFSTEEILDNMYMLIGIASQESEACDVGESGSKEGAESLRKRHVIFDRREGRDEYMCLVIPCKAIIRIQYL